MHRQPSDAMDSFMGDMKCQPCVHIERMVEKEVSLQLHAKMSDEQKKKEEKKEEKEEKKEVNGNMQTGPTANQFFFRRDIFKETVMEEES